MHHWPNIPPPFTPRAMRGLGLGPPGGGLPDRLGGVAQGPGPGGAGPRWRSAGAVVAPGLVLQLQNKGG